MNEEIFKRLIELHPNDGFWHNYLMFTKPVFLQESQQGNDIEKFKTYIKGNKKVAKLLHKHKFV